IPLDVTGAKIPQFMSRFKSAIDSAADAVHITTHQRVIANNLLFEEGDSLNPYLLAANERNLRNLPFIHDARIYVDTVTADEDSVDVFVITKDIWTIGIATSANFGTWYRARFFDANFLGYGQRLELNLTSFKTRDPHTGLGVNYTKNNLGGTFVDLQLGWSKINGGPKLGYENEESVFMSISRPMYLPTLRYTGGISMSLNRSINVFHIPHEDFRNYRYGLLDTWSAFSLSPDKSELRRLRKGEGVYLSGRLFRQNFFITPWQLGELYNPAYNERWFLLGAINFFRDRYYKTRYISGFGKTEDVPYGYRLSFTTGYQFTLFRHRYYAGAEFDRQFFRTQGSFGLYGVGAGSFVFQGRMEDIILRARALWYSKLLYLGHVKLRQKFYATFATALKPLFIGQQLIPNNEAGIRGFNSSVVYGHQRWILQSESTFWMPFMVLGFRFAAFVSVQIAQVAANQEPIFHQTAYAGLGGGFRIKNENTIFKTLEIRSYYYPVVPPGYQKWMIDMSNVVELRFTLPQIKVPGFIGFD
ncbi:MAG TPA: hypothetical protein VI731_02655, partial [Bacteroidia bacterium]|nr:hypothetical protein [Bacteroidia bacterium]